MMIVPRQPACAVSSGGSISAAALCLSCSTEIRSLLACLWGPDRIREEALRIHAPFRLRRRGVETKLVLGNSPKSVDRTLLRNIANALSWLDRIKAGKTYEEIALALLHGPEQIADLPVPVAESPGAVRIGHPERSHLVEYLAPNSVFNSLPRQRSSPHLRPDDRLVTIDRVLHHASLGVA